MLAGPCIFAGQTARIWRAVVPPFTGGLHCGSSIQFAVWPSRSPSSRRSPAGSIAGGMRSCGPLRVSWSSRRSPAGSIAGQPGGTIVSRCAGRPAVHRRAPLRASVVTRSGGLRHPSSRRSPAGSIAGGTLTNTAPTMTRSRRPAVHRRAPLRVPVHQDRLVAARQSSRRSPAASIAGVITWKAASSSGKSSRRSPAGSIAASSGSSAVRSATPVVPLLSGGRHCGRVSFGRHTTTTGKSSRCSAAGSIAASRACCRTTWS